jgi:hypothetical protein
LGEQGSSFDLASCQMLTESAEKSEAAVRAIRSE